jgi:hypothetical protein
MDREEFERMCGSPPFYDSIEEYKVDWNKWSGFGLYKKLWSLVGGRPWTYIYRDVWHRYEYVVQAQWFFFGLAVYHFLGWYGAMLFWIFYTLGYINGHFFWGRRYIPGQTGN